MKSGEDPILLNMTISAPGYNDKYYELELAVPPEEDKPIPSYNIFIVLGIICILSMFLHKKLKIQ